MYRAIAVALLVLVNGLGSAQPRPVPYPVFETPQFARAVERGTRSRDGRPGPDYWTNFAQYNIDVTVSPSAREIAGVESVRYFNNSPDVLRRIVINLYQNIFKENAMRNRRLRPTGGLALSCAFAMGEPLIRQIDPRIPGYVIEGSKMYVHLATPLPPGGSIEMRFCWNFTIPTAADQMRMGHDGSVFFLAYWYPQFAVYDDVTGYPEIADGWDQDHHMGTGEYYMGYADYNVLINAPTGWLVPATGSLVNADELFTPDVLARLERAAIDSSVVTVIDDDTRATSFIGSPTGVSTWHYRAENVRDFAFGLSRMWRWDATHALAGDVDEDGTQDRALIHAFYRPEKPAWNRAAEFAKFSIEDMSRRVMPYPWPHFTSVEGFITGGMEYPMMMLAGGNRDDGSLLSVSSHIVSHMWFPMIVGQDEKEYTWMDEGLVTFNQTEEIGAFWNTDEVWDPERQAYYQIAGTGYEVESMRHGDLFPIGTNARGLGSYNKPSVFLHALRGLVGEETFYRAYREYAARWQYKHPTPYDFFNTFEDVIGVDLDWFWRPAFFETWTLDQAIAKVENTDQAVRVTVADLGLIPMPVPISVTYSDGRVEETRISVDVWLTGVREASTTFSPGNPVRVEIDEAGFLPDIDRTNNVWISTAQSPGKQNPGM